MPGEPIAVEERLPCGLRLLVARDDSLPVAAVVLRIDAGTRDDPADYPGLVQALAYHLLAGNHELRPGAALAAVHDFGGWAGLAISAAQVRYESLVPASQLDRVLWVESQRLRAPTVNRNLWLKSLAYAREARGPDPLVPHDVWAAAWDDQGLAHDGHRLTSARLEALRGMVDGQISAQLQRLFNYARATLVVVAPGDPQRTAQRVRPLFVDLPLGPASPPAVSPPEPSQSREIPGGRGRGESFVWPVSARPGAEGGARTFCDALNRLKRARDEPKRVGVRCAVTDDPTRRVVLVRVTGSPNARATLDQRVRRLSRGRGRRALDRHRVKRRAALAYDRRLPLDLATTLARVQPNWPTAAAPSDAEAPGPAVPLAALTGDAALASLDAMTGVVSVEDWTSAHAVRLVPAPAGKRGR
ncbi:MAG: insulinase family protein [Myxococcales bacterium FL481]|nr:MAG: insulinase family protein [Myxococcales bacterium FL481]